MPSTGYQKSEFCHKQGRKAIFVLNRVRVWEAGPHLLTHPKIYRVPPPPRPGWKPPSNTWPKGVATGNIKFHFPAFLPGGGRREIESLLSPLTPPLASYFFFCWRSPLFAHVHYLNTWNRCTTAVCSGLLSCGFFAESPVRFGWKKINNHACHIFCPGAVFRQSRFVVLSLEFSPLCACTPRGDMGRRVFCKTNLP